jgi:hypothetical protein
VVNAAVTIKVLASHDKPNNEIPAPVEDFGLAEETFDTWV